jgi:hypothetical protein
MPPTLDLQRRAVLVVTRVTMLDGLCRARERTVVVLLEAAAQMFRDIDPDDQRDHRNLWELTGRERAQRPDLFDRVRFAGDELVVIGSQLAAWRGGKPSPERDYAESVARFRTILEREQRPLVQLEHDVPAVQLERLHHPGLIIAALPQAVKAMRHHHDRALAVLEVLEELAQ